MMLSIVVVTYNSSGVLNDCLKSIRNNQKGFESEVIIIDNNSLNKGEQENLSLVAREFDDLGINLVKSPENLGFGPANNRGVKISNGKYLLFLNADTVLGEDSLNKMVNFLENNPKTGATGPKLITGDGKIQEWSCGKKTSLLKTIKNNFGFIPRHLWQSESPLKVDWVSGAALMVRKSVFEEIGGFDENFFMYFEDEDLCWRIKETGYDVYYLGDVIITHLGGQSFKHSGTNSLQKKFFYQSQDFFFRKHYGVITSAIVRFLRFLIT